MLDGMLDYYRRRAPTYDALYARPERQAELRAIEAELAATFAGRRVLEVAAGTGWWTPHGARHARSWLATDLAAETLAIAAARPLPASVELRQADAWALDAPGALGDETFDAAFAGCWWSHVPRQRLRGWLDGLHTRLEPGAVVVMLDNRYVSGRSTPIARRDADGNGYQQRSLDDGSTHEVLKNHPTADEAIATLGPRARAPRWTEHAHHWVLRYELV